MFILYYYTALLYFPLQVQVGTNLEFTVGNVTYTDLDTEGTEEVGVPVGAIIGATVGAVALTVLLLAIIIAKCTTIYKKHK